MTGHTVFWGFFLTVFLDGPVSVQEPGDHYHSTHSHEHGMSHSGLKTSSATANHVAANESSNAGTPPKEVRHDPPNQTEVRF